MIVVAFSLGAALGVALRHAVNQLGRGWIGTTTVNVVGAFLFGWLVATGGDDAITVVGGGLLGSFTTFSTLALEVVEAPARRSILIVGVTLAAGLPAAFVGAALA